MEGGDPQNDEMVRMLIATDCHLGYMEKDEIRREDTFTAFEEICGIAQERQVDFILLAGDLFHENKPSRATLVRTIQILRRYCMSDRPVQFQVVSDQTVNFSNSFGHVNYEDPHFNVGMPIFTIHGNHDDPAGVDNLSAIDILAACNLVNYFGKSSIGGSAVGQVAIAPVLIRKANTNVALYGLGNIRDERLNRMFQEPHGVQWIRPEPQEGAGLSDWFNIFVLHQNRGKTNPIKNAISEYYLAKFLDFVVWGHEHECKIEPEHVQSMTFWITQPGSSVATSLIDGEAKPKHVMLLQVKGKFYKTISIRLESVRPFEHCDVSLKDEPDLDSNDQNAVVAFLDRQVHRLIKLAEEKRPAGREPMLPLVRIRVDYTGFSTVNPQQFGQRFVGKVANPHDILLFTKAPKKRLTAPDAADEAEVMRPEELNQHNIEALMQESNLRMEILPVQALGTALHEFVNKDDKQAFHTCVKLNLDDTRTKLVQEGDAGRKLEEKDILDKVSQHLQKREAEEEGRRAAASSSGRVAGASENGSSLKKQVAAAGGPREALGGTGRGSGPVSAAGLLNDDNDEDEADDIDLLPRATRADGAGRAAEGNSSRDDDGFGEGAGAEWGGIAAGQKAGGGRARGASGRGRQQGGAAAGAAATPTSRAGRGGARGRGAAAAGAGAGGGGRALKQSTLNLTSSQSQRPTQRSAAAAATLALQRPAAAAAGAADSINVEDDIASGSDDPDVNLDDNGGDDDDDMEDDLDVIKPTSRSAQGRKRAAPARGRGGGSSGTPRGRGGGGRATKRGRAGPGSTPLSAKRTLLVDDDDEEEDEDNNGGGERHMATPAASARSRSSQLRGSVGTGASESPHPSTQGARKWGSLRR